MYYTHSFRNNGRSITSFVIMINGNMVDPDSTEQRIFIQDY